MSLLLKACSYHMFNCRWKMGVKYIGSLSIHLLIVRRRMGTDGTMTVVETVATNKLGFCLLWWAWVSLVGSQDVAHDLDLLKHHSVSHIQNVGCGIANAFEDVSHMKGSYR